MTDAAMQKWEPFPSVKGGFFPTPATITTRGQAWRIACGPAVFIAVIDPKLPAYPELPARYRRGVLHFLTVDVPTVPCDLPALRRWLRQSRELRYRKLAPVRIGDVDIDAVLATRALRSLGGKLGRIGTSRTALSAPIVLFESPGQWRVVVAALTDIPAEHIRNETGRDIPAWPMTPEVAPC